MIRNESNQRQSNSWFLNQRQSNPWVSSTFTYLCPHGMNAVESEHNPSVKGLTMCWEGSTSKCQLFLEKPDKSSHSRKS
ncbi:unnamed protein product, partial [Gulo gulo]